VGFYLLLGAAVEEWRRALSWMVGVGRYCRGLAWL
jgi:hypothetical protein